MSAVSELEQLVAEVAGSVGPATVGIGHRHVLGSGVIVAPGKVLTNAHNIRGEEATVTFADGRSEVGAVAGADVDGDVAIISVDTGGGSVIEWADGAGVEIGKAVVALANPRGRGLRVTWGLISATERSFRGPRGRRIAGSIEHTAPLLPGSSGGPLVDASGRLLGINTNRLGEGFYLAIPADGSLKAAVDALGRGEEPSRPRLGVAIAPPEVGRGLRRAVGLPEIDGLLVRGVSEGSPAADAGLQEGDLITGVSGRPATSADDLFDALGQAGVEQLELEVVRGTETRSVTVRLRADNG